MPYESPASQQRLDALFTACGTTREEAGFHAFPAHLVPERMTTAEQLAQAERLNLRDRQLAQAPLASYALEPTGSERHRQYAIRFRYTDGTEQYFPPHSN